MTNIIIVLIFAVLFNTTKIFIMFKGVRRTKVTKESKEFMSLEEAISFIGGFCGVQEKNDIEVDCKLNWGMIIHLDQLNKVNVKYYQ